MRRLVMASRHHTVAEQHTPLMDKRSTEWLTACTGAPTQKQSETQLWALEHIIDSQGFTLPMGKMGLMTSTLQGCRPRIQ